EVFMLIKRFAHGLILSAFVLTPVVPAQQPTRVATVEVTSSAKEAEVGQEVKLTVVAKDASGNVVNEPPSTYFAGPFDAATADENGVIKLHGPGEVTAGALVGGKPGFVTIVVKPAGIKTLEIAEIKAPLVVGGTVRLEATARIFSGDPRTDVPVSWSSDKPSVATVDAGGIVTGTGVGRATIKATAQGASATTTITVINNALRSLAIEPATTSAKTGDVVHFTAKGTPADSFTARWSVSGSGATVYPDGAFVAEQPGTYIISASSGNVAATASVVVAPRNIERELTVVGRVPFKEIQGAAEWIIGDYAYYSALCR